MAVSVAEGLLEEKLVPILVSKVKTELDEIKVGFLLMFRYACLTVTMCNKISAQDVRTLSCRLSYLSVLNIYTE